MPIFTVLVRTLPAAGGSNRQFSDADRPIRPVRKQCGHRSMTVIVG